MFGAFLNFLMAPVNFVRKTFGWLSDEADGDVSDAPELLEATVANGGSSASTFSAMQEAVYGNGINGSQTSTTTTATDFAGLSIYIPDVITAEDGQTFPLHKSTRSLRPTVSERLEIQWTIHFMILNRSRLPS